MNKKIIAKAVFILLLTTGMCRACECAKSSVGSEQEKIDANTVDGLLKLLHRKTKTLKSYEGKIEYLISQPLFDSNSLRKGVLYYQKSDGKSALRINFETLKQDDDAEQRYIQHYVFDGLWCTDIDYQFDGAWLTCIDYEIKTVKCYQLAEPNEPNKPMDAFDLVSKNLPIVGFTKVENLKKQFEIQLIEQNKEHSSVIPAKAGIQDLAHLHLKVKPDSVYKEDYTSIDFWIDKKLYLPAKIVAVNTEEDIYQIKFLKPAVNKTIDRKVFEIEISEGFDEPEITPLKKGKKAN